METKTKLVRLTAKKSESYMRLLPWIIACMMIIGINYAYYDCIDAVRNSVNVWYALFDGKFLNFYSYTRYAEHEITFPVFQGVHNGASYSYLAYLVFGLWTFPLYILERFLGVNLFWHSWGVVYAKTGLLLVSYISSNLLGRITYRITGDAEKSEMAALLYLTSPFFFSSTVAVGQLEAITIYLMLMGFWYYLDDSPLFLLFFSLAIPFKYFALIAFIPLLLIKEKNILRIGLKSVAVVTPTVLSFLLFLKDQYRYVGVMEDSDRPIGDNTFSLLSDGMMSSGSTWSVGGLKINLFFVALIILWVWCYVQNTKSEAELAQKAAFGAFATLLSFLLLFSPVYPYWCILMVPFGILAIIFNARNIKEAVITGTIASASYVLWQLVSYYWVFGLYAMQSNVFLSEKQPFATTEISVLNYWDLAGRIIGIPLVSLYSLGFASLVVTAFIYLVKLVYPSSSKNRSNVFSKEIAIRLGVSFSVMMIAAICVYGLMLYKGLIL